MKLQTKMSRDEIIEALVPFFGKLAKPHHPILKSGKLRGKDHKRSGVIVTPNLRQNMNVVGFAFFVREEDELTVAVEFEIDRFYMDPKGYVRGCIAQILKGMDAVAEFDRKGLTQFDAPVVASLDDPEDKLVYHENG